MTGRAPRHGDHPRPVWHVISSDVLLAMLRRVAAGEDPPYSNDEAALMYSTPPLKPGRFVAEAVRVTRAGGHVAVYGKRWPPRPQGTRLVRRIVVLTRCQHAPRVCFVFEKLSPALTLEAAA